MKQLLVLLFLTVGFFHVSFGVPLWGPTGHAITAQIGQTLLDDGATSMVDKLLANVSGQMYMVSDWADQILNQSQWQWSAPLHYINTPDWACTYDAETDCANNMCVAGAITNYTDQLAEGDAVPHQEQEYAIRFDIHFHGDIHQPLHVGFASNKGGNTIQGYYMGTAMNLHEVWDSGLINTRITEDFDGSQTQYVNYLVEQMNGPWKKMAQVWSVCNSTSSTDVYACPAQWASESALVACNYAYTDQDGEPIENGFNLGDPYFEFVKTVLDQQLIKGGVRLAATFNNLWSKDGRRHR